MSETRQTRKQLRESLVQHTFHYFEELKKTNSDTNARKIVISEINDLRALFLEEETSVSFLSVLEEQESHWLDKNKESLKTQDIDTQFYSEDVLSAIKLLREATKGENYGTK